MLKLSKAQQQSIADQQFIARVLRYLRLQYPDTTCRHSDAAMTACIRIGLYKARHYNIQDERGQVTFIDLMITIARDFDMDSTIHAILTDKSVTFPPVLDRLNNEIASEVWRTLSESSSLS